MAEKGFGSILLEIKGYSFAITETSLKSKIYGPLNANWKKFTC